MGVEELRSQVVSWGSCNDASSTMSARIIFSVKMKAGTTVKFTGDKNVYNWAVVEVYDFGVTELNTISAPNGNATVKNPSQTENSIHDSGWLNNPSTSTYVESYTTQKDCWPMLFISRNDGAGIQNEVLPHVSYVFDVDGVKLSPTTAYDPGMITEE
jgi:hypothetical protein